MASSETTPAPTVAGVTQVGDTLMATPVTSGDEIDWDTCNADGSDLIGTLANNTDSYELQTTDIGTDVCAVEITQDTPPDTLVSVSQGPVTVQSDTAPTISTAPSGASATLSIATGGTWSPTPDSVQTQWVHCTSSAATSCSPTSAPAGQATYTPQPADVGKVIEIQETPVYGGVPDTAAQEYSMRSGAVEATSLTVSDTAPTTGETLSTTPVFSGDPVAWEACPGGVPSGTVLATTSTYVVKETDFGTPLCVVETSDGGAITSASTTAVADTHEAPPTISVAATGTSVTLTAHNATWGQNPGSINVQWVDCPAATTAAGTCAPISGATGQTYQPQTTDVGSVIEVLETPVYGGTQDSAVLQQSVRPGTVAAASLALSDTAPKTGETLTATPVFSGDAIALKLCPGGTPSGGALNAVGSNSYAVKETNLGSSFCAVETTADSSSATIQSATTAGVSDPNETPPGFNGATNENGSVTVADAQWGQAPDSVTVQWFDCVAPNGATPCTAVTTNSALNRSYTLGSGDVGKAIEVTETPVYGGSADAAVALRSVVPNTVSVIPAQLVSPPTISGTPNVGATLTESPAQWQSADPITTSVAWQRSNGSGGFTTVASGPTYTLTAADLGATLRAEETATTGGGATQAMVKADSTNTIGPVGETTASTAPPTISGAAQVGGTLSASPGSWNPSPASITFSYQWERCPGGTCGPIVGATGSTYNPSASDLGQPLAVVVTPQIFSTPSPSAPSARTAAVIPAPGNVPAAPTNTGPPTITGATRQGATLTASNGGWSGAPTGFDYQWVRCPVPAGSCVPLAGATSATYVPTATDAGHALAVIVSARNAGGTGPAVTSAHTAAIAATTTVKLTVAPSHTVEGEASRVTIAVASSSAGVPPAGTATVRRGANAVSGCKGLAVKGSSQTITVRCTAHLAAGTASLSAVFSPSADKPLVASPPATRSVSVARAPTTIVLNVPARATTNASLSYSASVESDAGQAPRTGTVVFEDGGHPVAGCEHRPVHDGTATCTLSYALTGHHVISARFTGAGDFAASTSGPTPERIVEPKAHGAVTATLNWTFHFTPRYTSIEALVLHRGLRGSTLTMSCAGPGCPFASRAVRITHSGKTVDLEQSFHGRRLGVRAKLVITITRAGDIGKYYRFTIRARQEPKILISCLALGSHRPGVGCTSH